MNLNKQIAAIKKKIVDPKFYVVELFCGTTAYLSTTIAYSLEEAISIVKKQLTANVKDIDLQIMTVGRYDIYSISDIIKQSIKFSTREVSMDKNELMKKIIETKNTKLYAENITIFTESEKKYLLEKMSLKKP